MRRPPPCRVVAATSSASGRPVGGQPARMPGRQCPVLASLVELVRRGADADAGDDHVLPGPGVASAGMRADGQVAEDADGHPGPPGRSLRGIGLLRGQPLEPDVEVHLPGKLPPQRGHLRRARVGEPGGPGPPVRAVHLRDRAPGRPVPDGLPVAFPEGVELRPAGGAQPRRVDDLQRRPLGRPDRVPVDQGRGRFAARSGAPSASTRARSPGLSPAYSGMSSMRR